MEQRISVQETGQVAKVEVAAKVHVKVHHLERCWVN